MPGAGLVDWAAYAATYWGSVGGLTLGWGFRAAGRRHLPPTGPVFIASNHQSFLDPLILGSAANRRLTYLARSTLFANPVLAAVLRHYDSVPIDRGFGKEGLQSVLAELDKGKAVLMFPEGERTHDGRLQPLRPGVSLLMKRLTCPIVPAAIAGAFDAWPRHRKWPTPDPLVLPSQGRSIAVAFGPPIDPARYKGMGRDEMLADLAKRIGMTYLEAQRVRRKVDPASGPRRSPPEADDRCGGSWSRLKWVIE